MYSNAVAEGYEMRQRALRPVYVGTLQVQMIAEYRGPELTGKVLRIENKGASEIELTEAMVAPRSEEHTSELQSLMRISYAVFCLKKKNKNQGHNAQNNA